MSNDEGLPFALANWIKKDQEERKAHQAKMALRNHEGDKQYIELLTSLTQQDWKKLKASEKQFVCSLVRQFEELRNFSAPQRSAIASMYYRYHAK